MIGSADVTVPAAAPAPDWVSFYAQWKPTSIALADADTGEERTWAEVDDRVSRIAVVLRDRYHLRPGDRVALLADNEPRVIEVQFACIRAGLIFVPLNWRLAVPEIKVIFDDAAPAILVHDEVHAVVARGVAESHDVPLLEWDGYGVPCAFEEAVSAVRPRRFERYHGVDDPLMILYTSGTTGRPKGALVTYNNLAGQTLNTNSMSAVAAAGTHVLAVLPLFHAGGLNVYVNPTLLSGGRVTTMSRFDPARFLEWTTDPAYGVTHVAVVPVLLKMVAQLPAFESADFGCLKHVISGGTGMPHDLLEQYCARNLPIWCGYGGTEVGPTTSLLNIEHRDKLLAGSIGRPMLSTELRLVGTDGHDVAQGAAGEIWLRGPAITTGYWGMDRHRAAFTDGWFRTGDIARVDEDGFLYFVDRATNMYKSGGERVYPAEVENVLAEHPAVAEAAVIGVPDERWDEVGAAFVVAANGWEVTLETLAQICAGRLAKYKVPKYLIIVDEFELNSTGKISRPALRRDFQTWQSERVGSAAGV